MEANEDVNLPPQNLAPLPPLENPSKSPGTTTSDTTVNSGLRLGVNSFRVDTEPDKPNPNTNGWTINQDTPEPSQILYDPKPNDLKILLWFLVQPKRVHVYEVMEFVLTIDIYLSAVTVVSMLATLIFFWDGRKNLSRIVVSLLLALAIAFGVLSVLLKITWKQILHRKRLMNLLKVWFGIRSFVWVFLCCLTLGHFSVLTVKFFEAYADNERILEFYRSHDDHDRVLEPHWKRDQGKILQHVTNTAIFPLIFLGASYLAVNFLS
jgi:hypothetical protein